MDERTVRHFEQFITAIALLAVTTLAFAAFTQAKADDTGGCPKGKTLFSIMDSDGTYKPICLPINAGGMK